MESMLRNINRQLEQHARIFGTDSETYKSFVHEIEREMGKANYTQRSGAVGYSRSVPMPYKFEDVQRANNKAKGDNTAAAKWSKAAQESTGKPVSQITKDDLKKIKKDEIKKLNNLKEEIEKNFESIYNYMKEELSDEFYSAKFSRLNPDTFDDSILKHIQKTTKYKTVDEIKKLIQKAKQRTEKLKKEIEEEAAKTNGGKMTKKEISRILRKKEKRR